MLSTPAPLSLKAETPDPLVLLAETPAHDGPSPTNPEPFALTPFTPKPLPSSLPVTLGMSHLLVDELPVLETPRDGAV
jgi:hypothetical protein